MAKQFSQSLTALYAIQLLVLTVPYKWVFTQGEKQWHLPILGELHEECGVTI